MKQANWVQRILLLYSRLLKPTFSVSNFPLKHLLFQDVVVVSGIDPLEFCINEQACRKYRQSAGRQTGLYYDSHLTSRQLKCPDCDAYMLTIQDYLLGNIDYFVSDLLQGPLYCQAPGEKIRTF